MKTRLCRAVWLTASLAFVAAAACQSSTQRQPPVAVTASIGPSGGQVATQGAVLSVPAGALASPTLITITEDPAGPPATYTALSPLFRFSPDGLTFAKPASVSFATSSNPPTGHVYWSLANGTGYDALPTTWVGATATASVQHFSSGFAGTPADGVAIDAGQGDEVEPQDATISDGGTLDANGHGEPQDATLSDGGTLDATPGPDGSGPADGSLPDAGSTYVSGEIDGPPLAGDTVTIDVYEFSSVPDADGGCTGQAATGHQAVTIPASALPYIYRFYFGTSTTSACAGRSYSVQAVESASDAGVLASGTNTCTGTFGGSLFCQVAMAVLPTDAGADDASDANAPETSGPSADAGDPFTSVITFSGTITGTVPPGASFIRVEIDMSEHFFATVNGAPVCDTPTVESFTGVSYSMLLPTLPATYSLQAGYDSADGGPNYCSAGFQVQAFAMNANFTDPIPLSGTTPGTTQCGCVGGCPGPGASYGLGGPAIQSTSVTCNVALP